MSTQSIEHDLAQFLEHAGYEVTFRHPYGGDEFHLYVVYEAQVIAFRRFRQRSSPDYERAARWALRMMDRHKRAMRMLGGLVRPCG